jgi:hypothetical protein
MDVRTILRVTALIIVVPILIGFAVLAQMRLFSTNGTGWGFGPEWDCTYPGKGDPVCIKRTPADAKNAN